MQKVVEEKYFVFDLNSRGRYIVILYAVERGERQRAREKKECFGQILLIDTRTADSF